MLPESASGLMVGCRHVSNDMNI